MADRIISGQRVQVEDQQSVSDLVLHNEGGTMVDRLKSWLIKKGFAIPKNNSCIEHRASK